MSDIAIDGSDAGRDLVTVLAARAATSPDQVGLHFPSSGRAYTWAELQELSTGLGRYIEPGVKAPGEIVLIISEDPREQILAFLGCLAIGACPSILSFPSAKQSEAAFQTLLESICAGCSPSVVVSSSRWRALAERGASTSGASVVDFPHTLPEATELPPYKPQGEDMMFLQFSSGTTGMRKSVAVTYDMFANQATAYAEALAFNEHDRVFSWLPLYHDMGLLSSFLIPVYCGVPAVHISPFDWLKAPASMFEYLHQYKATFCWLPNFSYARCADKVEVEELKAKGVDVAHVRAFVNCSEPVRSATHDRFIEAFEPIGVRREQLQASYAMAESTFAVTQTPAGCPAVVDTIYRDTFLENAVAEARDPRGGGGRTPDIGNGVLWTTYRRHGGSYRWTRRAQTGGGNRDSRNLCFPGVLGETGFG